MREITVADNLSDLDSQSYYGVISTTVEKRGFITRANFEDGLYLVKCIHRLTEGNGWSVAQEMTLAETVKKLLNIKIRVFEFETSKELFTWLTRKK